LTAIYQKYQKHQKIEMKKTETLLWLGLHANILVLCGVLGGSLFIQVVLGDFPCPLCMVQRMAMMLCALGQVYILCKINATGRICWPDFATGHAMTLFAALAGATMSIRQILLHIVPPDPGYGMAVFGLHLYTWGLFVFVAEVLAVAINLVLAPREWSENISGTRRLTRFVLGAMTVLLIAFAVATFVEQGFHWVLPDDPVRNELFYDLGIFKD
jgi:disulfide bond formation protein DsbB